MKADLKRKWVEALRSGKYKQGEGELRRGDAFCCLGVLADVRGAEWVEDEYGELGIPNGDGHVLTGALPVDWLAASIQEPLWRRNDGLGIRRHTFPEIAAWIEENIPEES